MYGFPIEAPFLVMHFDAYSAGKHSGFEGSNVYLIGCCGMCGFACMEPVSNPSVTTFASAIMKILLRYGFCHTSVLDKDSKFFGVCREALDLLKINFMCSPAGITTQCSSNVSTGTSTKASRL